MNYVKLAAFNGAVVVFDFALVVVNLVVFFTFGGIASLIAALFIGAFAVWQVFQLRRTFKDAERFGVKSRAEHQLESYYEAELQSIWESK